MRFKYEFAMKEYGKIKEYLEECGYRCEPTGSIRRKKEDVGDIDIVLTDETNNLKLKSKKRLGELEDEILEVVSKYSEIESRINRYEFMLKSGISIHMIPELREHFDYTLWHSTGPKPHVKLIKEIYRKKGFSINMVDTDEEKIYTDIGMEYMRPEERFNVK
jgi:DNA polymerase/3'-5' exonuclease PolX